MKLVSFGPQGQERPGVMHGADAIVDLTLASQGRISSIRNLLEQGEAGLDEVRKWLDHGPEQEWVKPADQVRFGPPVTNPTNIICLGLNYHNHAKEQDARLPERPLLFAKAVTSLAGNGDPIWYPADDKYLDYEAELAFVIGKPGFRIEPEEWESYIAGYTIVNDVSAREAQFSDRQWFRGKSCDSFCPTGPYLVTRDEIPDPHSLRLTATLNGELRQDESSADLIFDIPKIIAHVSLDTTLLPGDVIPTGTPAGVGIFMKPPACMSVGDEITISIEKLGSLTNKVEERKGKSLSVYPYTPA